MLRILTGMALMAIAAGAASAADYGGVAQAPAAGAYYGGPPACDAPDVLARVSEKFAYQDARVTFTGLAIERIDNISQSALKAGGPSLVDVRYCSGRAWLSNGQTSEVVYLIEWPEKGTFSVGYYVESCLPGYDPWRIYDARCRAIRP